MAEAGERYVNTLSSYQRPEVLKRMGEEQYDLVVIGGGITGAGIALDAASRGLKTALVEKGDFSSGTSSKSTKLIHGGLRYLKQFEIMLVREVGRERAVVHKLAPHLVTSEKMLLPIIKDGEFGKLLTSFGLMVYDVLAGVEKADQRMMLDVEESLEREPLLNPEGLEGAGFYAEYRTDDSRLTLEVVKSAAQRDADCLNYLEAVDFIYEDEKIRGIRCRDMIDGSEFDLSSSYVVSATGPWVDDLRAKDKSLEGKHLRLTKGVHIVVDHERFPLKQAVYFDVHDGRMIFAIPRGNITYIGTTDTDYSGDINNVPANLEDAEYLIKGVNHAFPQLELGLDDVVSSWAGLRPLIAEEGKSTSEISRKDEVFISESGLISIAGGKLTGYRKMAERVVDVVAKKIRKKEDRDISACFTDQIVLTGGPFENKKEVKAYRKQLAVRCTNAGLDEYHAWYLVSNYGRQADDILENLNDFDSTDPEVRLGMSELDFTLNNELVLNSVDFFERRTGRLYFDIRSIEKLKEPVIEKLGKEFNWSPERIEEEKAILDDLVTRASHFS